MTKFWMVLRDGMLALSVGFDNDPNQRYPSLAEAKAEAEKLCGRSNCAFYVLEAVARVTPKREVAWEESVVEKEGAETP